MAKYEWPEAGKRSLIGKRISRIDGPAKASGKAKYTFDIKRPGTRPDKLRGGVMGGSLSQRRPRPSLAIKAVFLTLLNMDDIRGYQRMHNM